jgi:LacI family transcriptional regulator
MYTKFMSVTLKQIADELNISQATVTNAMNGKPNVGEPMRLKIQETAMRMGYDKYANRGAQVLAAKRHGRRIENGVIALIYHVQEASAWQSIPFYRTLLDGVEDALGKRRVDLYIALQRDGALPRIVREQRVDGLIFLSGIEKVNHELKELAMPVATLGTLNPGTYSILPDGNRGTYQATKHLLDLGHRRIAYLGKVGGGAAQMRCEGYVSALTEHGIEVDHSLIQLWTRDPSVAVDDKSAMARSQVEMGMLLQRHRTKSARQPSFTAVVCQNDILAMASVLQAQAEGLKVPDDLSVVGFDDVSLQYNFEPSLTSVAYPRFEMGQRAVEWICEEVKSLIQGGNRVGEWQQPEGLECFPTTLSIRESTCAV